MALNNNKTIKVAKDKEAANWKVNEAKGNSNINIAARHSTARYRSRLKQLTVLLIYTVIVLPLHCQFIRVVRLKAL